MNLPFGTAEHPITINLYALVKWLMNKIKRRTMCVKKVLQAIFGSPAVETPMAKVDARILTFGKNKYGGGSNLNGCVPDANGMYADFGREFPMGDRRIFLDDQVTIANYTKYVSEAIATLDPGALVLVVADSCFSESATKNNVGKYRVSRFLEPDLPYREIIRKRVLQRPDLNLVEISGSRENETSADVYVNGQYQGALTYAFRKYFRADRSCREIFAGISTILPGSISDQHPQIHGTDERLDRKLNAGQLLIVHNSSHGSWDYDRNGDEADGRDEGLYFDKFFPDDEMYEIYKNIPA
jgi:hypothetical protein